MVYLTAWGMVERAYHADVGLGCDNMIYKFDSVCDVDFLGGYWMAVVDRIATMFSEAKRIYDRAVETMDNPDWDDWSIDRQMSMLDWSIDIINRQMVKIRDLMVQYEPFLFIQQFGQSKLDVLNVYIQKLVRKYEKLTDY